MLRRAAPIAILIAAIWVTFSPALTFSFLNWDGNLVVGVRRRRAWRRSRAGRDRSVQITARGQHYR
jgi:hypothetical protein